MPAARELLRQAVAALDAGHWRRAEDILDDMHHRWHADAAVHVRVHWHWSQLHARKGQPLKAGWELVAMAFAAPASWVQKYLGLARRGY